MKPNRPWISLIFFCFAAVSMAALAFAAVVAGGSFALVRFQKADASQDWSPIPIAAPATADIGISPPPSALPPAFATAQLMFWSTAITATS